MNIQEKIIFNMSRLQKFFSLPILLSFSILMPILLGAYIDVYYKKIFYSVSLTIKELLVFILPLIILSYMMSSIMKIGKKGSVVVLGMLIFVMLSNFICTLIAYYVSSVTLSSDPSIALNNLVASSLLEPIWSLNFPKLISNEVALVTAIFLGIFGGYFGIQSIEIAAQKLSSIVKFFLNRIFIPTVPLFVTGFIFKLEYEGLLKQIVQSYTPVFGIIFTIQVSYVIFLYIIAGHFNFKRIIGYFKKTVPSLATAFCTMSSAATIPFTLKAAEENTQDFTLSRVLIPGTANIHLIGDSLGVPIMSMAILVSFGMSFPDFSSYIIFATQFVLGKFCVAAVPGGGIVVMVPILEQSLGFSPEMSALIAAFYILFDPINTSVNVSGNGVFVILMSRLKILINKNRFLRKESPLNIENNF